MGVRVIGRTPSKLGFPFFFFKGVMKPCFQIVGICPDSVISLNRKDKGLERKSPMALEETGYPKDKHLSSLVCQFFFLSQTGKQSEKKGMGNLLIIGWTGSGRLWTMEARNLLRLYAVTSGGSGKLKLRWSRLLPHSFLTSECQFLVY